MRQSRQLDLELLRQLFDQAPGFLALTTGPDHRFAFVNATFKDIIGADPTGRTISDALPEFERQGVVAMLDRVYGTGVPFRGSPLCLRIYGADQHETCFDMSSRPLFAGPGQDIICMGYEITDRIEAERFNLEARAKLTALARLSDRNTLIATLAHEISQPLAAARNYLSVLTDSKLPANERELATAAAAQIDRCGDIISRARSAIEGVKSPLRAIALRPSLNAALEVVRAAHDNSEVEVRLTGPADSCVQSDAIALEQVFTNVLANAFEAVAPNKDRLVDIQIAENFGVVTVEIGDNGPGLPEDAEAVFRPFRSPAPHLGLGLAISRTIIQTLRGSIWLKNREQAPGAVAVIRLPSAV